MGPAAVDFPPDAPLIPRPGVPELYRPVVLEHYLFPSVAEAVGLLLGVPVGFIPGSVVAARWTAAGLGSGGWAVARLTVNLGWEKLPAFLVQPLEVALEWGAIGLRRPPAGRESPRLSRTGRLEGYPGHRCRRPRVGLHYQFGPFQVAGPVVLRAEGILGTVRGKAGDLKPPAGDPGPLGRLVAGVTPMPGYLLQVLDLEGLADVCLGQG